MKKTIAIILILSLVFGSVLFVNAEADVSTVYEFTKRLARFEALETGTFFGSMETAEINGKTYTYIATEGTNTLDSTIYVYDTTDDSSYSLIQTITTQNYNVNENKIKVLKNNYDALKYFCASDGSGYLLFQTSTVLLACKVGDNGKLSLDSNSMADVIWAGNLNNRYSYRFDTVGDYVLIGQNCDRNGTLVDIIKYNNGSFIKIGSIDADSTQDLAEYTNTIIGLPIYGDENNLIGISIYIGTKRMDGNFYIEAYDGIIAENGSIAFTNLAKVQTSEIMYYSASPENLYVLFGTASGTHYKYDITSKTLSAGPSTGTFPVAVGDGYYVASGKNQKSTLYLYNSAAETVGVYQFDSTQVELKELKVSGKRVTGINYNGYIAAADFSKNNSESVFDLSVCEGFQLKDAQGNLVGYSSVTNNNGNTTLAPATGLMDVAKINGKTYVYVATTRENSSVPGSLYVFSIVNGEARFVQHIDTMPNDTDYYGGNINIYPGYENLKVLKASNGNYILFQSYNRLYACPINSDGSIDNTEFSWVSVNSNSGNYVSLITMEDYVIVLQCCQKQKNIAKIYKLENGSFMEKGVINSTLTDGTFFDVEEVSYFGAVKPLEYQDGNISRFILYITTKRTENDVVKYYLENYGGTIEKDGSVIFSLLGKTETPSAEYRHVALVTTNMLVLTTSAGVKVIADVTNPAKPTVTVDSSTENGVYMMPTGDGCYIGAYYEPNQGTGFVMYDSTHTRIDYSRFTMTGNFLREVRLCDGYVYGIDIYGLLVRAKYTTVPYCITVNSISKNGDKLPGIKEGTIKIDVSVNNINGNGSITIIAAKYSDNGNILEDVYEINSVGIEGSEDYTFNISVNSDDDLIRIFVWDSVDGNLSLSNMCILN